MLSLELDAIELRHANAQLKEELASLRRESQRKELLHRMIGSRSIPTPEQLERFQDELVERGLA
jgi:hypothetical protein